MPLPEQDLITLLVKLGVVASLASILVRSTGVKHMLLREMRTLGQRARLTLWFSLIFGAGVGIRVITTRFVAGGGYMALDLGLEGSLLAGILGGYFTGLLSGVLISIPALINREWATIILLAGVGVIGGLIRDLAADPEDIWTFSPFLDLTLSRLLRPHRVHRRTIFHAGFLLAILAAELLRQVLGQLFAGRLFFLPPQPHWFSYAAVYLTTLFAVTLPLKIWNNARNELKIEEQQRSLMQARLDALTRQINPHFLFNTLNSVSSLIRTDPQQARVVIYRLSSLLRRLLRRHENFSALREELGFIDDYLSIEMIRFGDKLRFEKDVDPETLEMQLPSMMLQPLVENCIKHGLGNKLDGGSILVRTRVRDGRLSVTVEDDGVGIPEAKLANLQERGIGVRNVSERLAVLFGNGYSMRIESKPGQGTRVEIELPEVRAAAPARDLATVP